MLWFNTPQSNTARNGVKTEGGMGMIIISRGALLSFILPHSLHLLLSLLLPLIYFPASPHRYLLVFRIRETLLPLPPRPLPCFSLFLSSSPFRFSPSLFCFPFISPATTVFILWTRNVWFTYVITKILDVRSITIPNANTNVKRIQPSRDTSSLSTVINGTAIKQQQKKQKRLKITSYFTSIFHWLAANFNSLLGIRSICCPRKIICCQIIEPMVEGSQIILSHSSCTFLTPERTYGASTVEFWSCTKKNKTISVERHVALMP